MRLTCPNCGAQYEVPDEVIPQTGRDVQCSNCGDTWFQPHRDHAVANSEDDAEGVTPAKDDWEEPEAPAASPPPPPAAEDFAPPPSDTPQPSRPKPAQPQRPQRPETATPDAARTDGNRPERREIDPSVASVLREEAEREKRARAAAQGGVETQPDLGLKDDEGESRRQREARQHMARMRGTDKGTGAGDTAGDTAGNTDDDDLNDIDPKSRRSLFPDIEEINSSLGPEPAPYANAGSSEYEAYPEPEQQARGGFRGGFLLSLLVAVLALLVYVFAAPIAAQVPALEGVLADYVTWVDGLRVWLDGQIAALMLWLDSVVAGTPGGGDGG